MDSYDSIQASYIAALRGLQPGLLAWWSALAGVENPNDPPPPEVARRWPVGIAAHPRVIAVFREHFLRIDELNLDYLDERDEEDEERDPEELWGQDDEGRPVEIRSPQDLLIHDVKEVAPDLAKLVAGIVFVPVGLDQNDESV